MEPLQFAAMAARNKEVVVVDLAHGQTSTWAHTEQLKTSFQRDIGKKKNGHTKVGIDVDREVHATW